MKLESFEQLYIFFTLYIFSALKLEALRFYSCEMEIATNFMESFQLASQPFLGEVKGHMGHSKF